MLHASNEVTVQQRRAHCDFVWAADIALFGSVGDTACWDHLCAIGIIGGVGHPDADFLALALVVGDADRDGDGGATVAVRHVLDLIPRRATVAAAVGVGGAPCNSLVFLHANMLMDLSWCILLVRTGRLAWLAYHQAEVSMAGRDPWWPPWSGCITVLKAMRSKLETESLVATGAVQARSDMAAVCQCTHEACSICVTCRGRIRFLRPCPKPHRRGESTDSGLNLCTARTT